MIFPRTINSLRDPGHMPGGQVVAGSNPAVPTNHAASQVSHHSPPPTNPESSHKDDEPEFDWHPLDDVPHLSVGELLAWATLLPLGMWVLWPWWLLGLWGALNFLSLAYWITVAARKVRGWVRGWRQQPESSR